MAGIFPPINLKIFFSRYLNLLSLQQKYQFLFTGESFSGRCQTLWLHKQFFTQNQWQRLYYHLQIPTSKNQNKFLQNVWHLFFINEAFKQREKLLTLNLSSWADNQQPCFIQVQIINNIKSYGFLNIIILYNSRVFAEY